MKQNKKYALRKTAAYGLVSCAVGLMLVGSAPIQADESASSTDAISTVEDTQDTSRITDVLNGQVQGYIQASKPLTGNDFIVDADVAPDKLPAIEHYKTIFNQIPASYRRLVTSVQFIHAEDAILGDTSSSRVIKIRANYIHPDQTPDFSDGLAMMFHELGHVIDFASIQGSGDSLWSISRDPYMRNLLEKIYPNNVKAVYESFADAFGSWLKYRVLGESDSNMQDLYNQFDSLFGDFIFNSPYNNDDAVTEHTYKESTVFNWTGTFKSDKGEQLHDDAHLSAFYERVIHEANNSKTADQWTLVNRTSDHMEDLSLENHRFFGYGEPNTQSFGGNVFTVPGRIGDYYLASCSGNKMSRIGQNLWYTWQDNIYNEIGKQGAETNHVSNFVYRQKDTKITLRLIDSEHPEKVYHTVEVPAFTNYEHNGLDTHVFDSFKSEGELLDNLPNEVALENDGKTIDVRLKKNEKTAFVNVVLKNSFGSVVERFRYEGKVGDTVRFDDIKIPLSYASYVKPLTEVPEPIVLKETNEDVIVVLEDAIDDYSRVVTIRPDINIIGMTDHFTFEKTSNGYRLKPSTDKPEGTFYPVMTDSQDIRNDYLVNGTYFYIWAVDKGKLDDQIVKTQKYSSNWGDLRAEDLRYGTPKEYDIYNDDLSITYGENRLTYEYIFKDLTIHSPRTKIEVPLLKDYDLYYVSGLFNPLYGYVDDVNELYGTNVFDDHKLVKIEKPLSFWNRPSDEKIKAVSSAHKNEKFAFYSDMIDALSELMYTEDEIGLSDDFIKALFMRRNNFMPFVYIPSEHTIHAKIVNERGEVLKDVPVTGRGNDVVDISWGSLSGLEPLYDLSDVPTTYHIPLHDAQDVTFVVKDKEDAYKVNWKVYDEYGSGSNLLHQGTVTGKYGEKLSDKLDLSQYKLDELSKNRLNRYRFGIDSLTGSTLPQTVDYSFYAPDKVNKQNVFIQYVDDEGGLLAPTIRLSLEVGKSLGEYAQLADDDAAKKTPDKFLLANTLQQGGLTLANKEEVLQTLVQENGQQVVQVRYQRADANGKVRFQDPLGKDVHVAITHQGKFDGTLSTEDKNAIHDALVENQATYSGMTIHVPNGLPETTYTDIDTFMNDLNRYRYGIGEMPTITVTYQNETHEETKQVKRMVRYHENNALVGQEEQVVTFTRQATKNLADNSYTYSEWTSEHPQFDALTIPEKDNRQTNVTELESKVVTADDKDEIIDVYYSPKTSDGGTQTDNPDMKDSETQTKATIYVVYKNADGTVYKEFDVQADKGTVLDGSDLEMLPDDMDFTDDFTTYEVKGDGTDAIERTVKKNTSDSGTQTDKPDVKDDETQTKASIHVVYRNQDGTIYKEFDVQADKGTILDGSDLEMLPDDMEFNDDFMFYEVKGDGHDVIERTVKKLTSDSDTQTDNPDTSDGSTQTDNPTTSDGSTQTDTPDIKDDGTQTDNPDTSDGSTQTKAEIKVVYKNADGTVYKEFVVNADKGTILDASDLEMLPDDMDFDDDFMFYEVKGDGSDEIVRVVKKHVSDEGTQTETPETNDGLTQTDEPSTSDNGTQTDNPSTNDKGSQTDNPDTSDGSTQTNTPDSKDNGTQTNKPNVSDKGSQTDKPDIKDDATQTDRPKDEPTQSVLKQDGSSDVKTLSNKVVSGYTRVQPIKSAAHLSSKGQLPKAGSVDNSKLGLIGAAMSMLGSILGFVIYHKKH